MRNFLRVVLIFFLFVAPALADVMIVSPSNGDTVSSPFALSARAADCSSQPVRSMGYSLDNSHNTTIVRGTSLGVMIAAPAGTHAVHVKAWTYSGTVCAAQITVKVGNEAGDAATETPLVPANAVSVTHLEALQNWIAANDTATKGAASGATRVVASPSRSGLAREFTTAYSNGGDERYAIFFGNDPNATNFLYDAWVYLTNSAGNIANLEMDVNQGMSNGQTVIYGFQCDGYSGTWDYSANNGTAEQPSGEWMHSRVSCNVRKWSRNQWHHIQIAFSRDDSGNVTYQWVRFDGAQSSVNATVLGARALGWRPNLSTNFQVDGRGANGSATVYVDDLTIDRW